MKSGESIALSLSPPLLDIPCLPTRRQLHHQPLPYPPPRISSGLSCSLSFCLACLKTPARDTSDSEVCWRQMCTVLYTSRMRASRPCVFSTFVTRVLFWIRSWAFTNQAEDFALHGSVDYLLRGALQDALLGRDLHDFRSLFLKLRPWSVNDFFTCALECALMGRAGSPQQFPPEIVERARL